jgi:hypothetical protein
MCQAISRRRRSAGSSNTILINEKPLILPPPCSENNAYARLGGEDHPFETGKAPAGRLLVIRDELEKTYDSRFFGVVSRDKAKGKALLIYWSPNACTGWKRNQPRPPRPPGGGAARWGRLSGLVTRKQAGGTARVAPEARQRAKPLPATPPMRADRGARHSAWCCG